MGFVGRDGGRDGADVGGLDGLVALGRVASPLALVQGGRSGCGACCFGRDCFVVVVVVVLGHGRRVGLGVEHFGRGRGHFGVPAIVNKNKYYIFALFFSI